MIYNYLLSTLRNISRYKGFFILNVLGLAIGIAASLLILQYVKDELSYDDFNSKADRIYRVEFDAYRDGEIIFKSATAFPKVAPMLIADYPEIEDATRLYLRYGGGVIRYEDVSIKEDNLFQAEQNLFDIFSYPIVDGEARLDHPNTALVEEVIAKKYFGDESPIGKRIKLGGNEEYEITGIVRSPENSHLKFSFLFSYPTLVSLWGEDFNNAWGWYDFYNYVLLKPGADPQALESKFPTFINKYDTREGADQRTKFVLQPLLQIHLYSDLIQEARVNGNGQTVYFLMIIAFFILVIAWVNYINLSTARAVERAKEVGIRKSIGAGKFQLMGQFIAEAFLVNLVSAVIGLMILYTAIPFFNELASKHLTYSIFSDSYLWLALATLYLVGSLFSGTYPAFVLSSYQPARILKGTLKGSREGIMLRKVLVVTQFAVSVALIAGTIIVFRQLQFMQNRDLGININQTVVINGPGYVQYDSLYPNYLEAYRNRLSEHPDLKNFTATSEIPGNLIYWTTSALRIGDDQTQANQMYILGIDYEYLKTFGNELVAGRGYSREFTADSSSVILNRKAIETFNLQSPDHAIGQHIRIGSDTFQIVGVIENFHQEGLKQDFRPTAFRLQVNARSYFCVKFNTTDVGQTLAYLRDEYD
ncbi:MAG: FtsX-like permease family protein [Flammeovirgaceae bacterium]|nr:FtsX-like permease family protein [Flammeovirgaceae bacterium]